MLQQNPYQKYKSTQIMTADSKTLLIMLLEGANRFLRQARDAMIKKEFERSNTLCIKVEKIVMELMNSLDISYGDFTKNLLCLYEYMYRRLVEANMNKDTAIIDEVLSLLGDMEKMWKEVYNKVVNGEQQ